MAAKNLRRPTDTFPAFRKTLACHNNMKAIRKVKTVCPYSPCTCFLQLIIGFQCSVRVWKLPHAVARRACHVVSAELCRLRILSPVRCYSFSAGWGDLRLSCWRGKLLRGIVLLHENACPHTAWHTQALLHEQFHWDIFKHPPYSPDLAPSDFFLFPKMKQHLVGKLFANDEDVKDAGWITRQPRGMKRVRYTQTDVRVWQVL